MIKRCINKVIVYYSTVIVLASNYTEKCFVLGDSTQMVKDMNLL